MQWVSLQAVGSQSTQNRSNTYPWSWKLTLRTISKFLTVYSGFEFKETAITEGIDLHRRLHSSLTLYNHRLCLSDDANDFQVLQDSKCLRQGFHVGLI